MENFILAESYGRSNIQHRLWYVMSKDDLKDVKAQFGDRAYAITEGQTYYMGKMKLGMMKVAMLNPTKNQSNNFYYGRYQ